MIKLNIKKLQIYKNGKLKLWIKILSSLSGRRLHVWNWMSARTAWLKWFKWRQLHPFKVFGHYLHYSNHSTDTHRLHSRKINGTRPTTQPGWPMGAPVERFLPKYRVGQNAGHRTWFPWSSETPSVSPRLTRSIMSRPVSFTPKVQRLESDGKVPTIYVVNTLGLVREK